jgi:HAD superfamily hydrolase (TIGR01509 family)
VKALFWDNDGVLVETETLYFRATREVLAGAGVEIDEEHYTEFALRTGRSLLELAAEGGASAAQVEALRRERNARYAELLRGGVAVLDGVVDALRALHGRVPMAVVTTSNRDHFELVHARTGLLGFFDFVLASGEYERPKPHPDPYLAAAARMGASPEECWAVEDSERGVLAASRAGMRCLAVPGGLTRGGDFSRAHRVLASAREVPAIVEALL